MTDKKKDSGVDTAWFDEQLRTAKTSIRAIARRGRFSASTLSRVVRGKIPLNLPCAIVLADAFGVSIEEIIKRCDFQPPKRKDVKTQKTVRSSLISQGVISTLRRRNKASKKEG